MNLYITYRDGTTLMVPHVESVRMVSATEIETNTFGNVSVRHRNVRLFATTYEHEEAL